MGLFEKLINPVWHEINKLPGQAKFEVAAIVLVHGYLRKALLEELVDPFEKLCELTNNVQKNGKIAASYSDELQKAARRFDLSFGKKVTPFSVNLRERLIDEVEIGYLCCVKGKPFCEDYFKILRSSEVIKGIGCFVLAEINARLDRNGPDLLEKTGYSQDPDECRTQIIKRWIEFLGLQDPECVSIISTIYFEERWRMICKDLLKGIETGFMRVEWEVLFKKTSEKCAEMSPKGRAMVGYLSSQLRQKTQK